MGYIKKNLLCCKLRYCYPRVRYEILGFIVGTQNKKFIRNLTSLYWLSLLQVTTHTHTHIHLYEKQLRRIWTIILRINHVNRLEESIAERKNCFSHEIDKSRLNCRMGYYSDRYKVLYTGQNLGRF